MIDVRIRTTHTNMVPLFHRRHLLKNRIDSRPIRGIVSDVFPNDLPLLIHKEHGRPRDAFGRMEDSVLLDEVFVNVGKDRKAQVQFRRHLLSVGRTVGTNGNHLGPEGLDLRIIFLQLAELRAAEPSSLSPVENNQNRLLALKRIQVDACALNRKTADVRCDPLNLKGKQ